MAKDKPADSGRRKGDQPKDSGPKDRYGKAKDTPVTRPGKGDLRGKSSDTWPI